MKEKQNFLCVKNRNDDKGDDIIMENLLNSLSLNNLYRYFLPGALVSYYFAWRWDQKLNLLPDSTSSWSIFVVISFGVGAFIYLLYRGLLHPWWCVAQYKLRKIPAFEIYLESINELYLSINPKKTYNKLLQSQVCLGAFFSSDNKYKDWLEKNEFRISSIHFLYLITTACILIFVLELIFLIPTLQPCERLPLVGFIIIIFTGLTTLIVGEFYDRIADISEGQFLSSHIDAYKTFLKNTYYSLDSFKRLDIKKKNRIFWIIIPYVLYIVICICIMCKRT